MARSYGATTCSCSMAADELSRLKRHQRAMNWQVREPDQSYPPGSAFLNRWRVAVTRQCLPSKANANAAPYSTSRLFESSSAAFALCRASEAFPKKASPDGRGSFVHGRPFRLVCLPLHIDGAARHRSGLLQVTGIGQNSSLRVVIQSAVSGLSLPRAAARSISGRSPL